MKRTKESILRLDSGTNIDGRGFDRWIYLAGGMGTLVRKGQLGYRFPPPSGYHFSNTKTAGYPGMGWRDLQANEPSTKIRERRAGYKYQISDIKYQISDSRETTNRRKRMGAQPPIGVGIRKRGRRPI